MSLDVTLRAERIVEVYEDNITHNLGAMAEAAELYYPLWRPEEISITTAYQLVPVLKAGLERLKKDPEKFKALNPSNGWGDYDGLVNFVEEYLDSCKDNPDAIIHVSR